MIAAKLFTSVNPDTTPEPPPPMVKALLQQCVTAELLGWLLDCTIGCSSGEWGWRCCCAGLHCCPPNKHVLLSRRYGK
jgi:hypothetical protein